MNKQILVFDRVHENKNFQLPCFRTIYVSYRSSNYYHTIGDANKQHNFAQSKNTTY